MPTPWELCSIFVLLVFFIWSVFFNGHRKKVTLSALQTFTLGVLIAGVLLFIPGYWGLSKKLEHIYEQVVYTATMSLADAIRLFLLDIKWGELEEMNYQNSLLYFSFLSVLAPVLTFSNVLSFFGSFFGTMRLSLCTLRKVFVMSELNIQSLALAKDIRNRRQGILPPLIVFASATEDHPLREQARQLSSLCLKGETYDLPIAPWGRRVEFFLLGDDESANVSSAAQLRKKHQKKLRAVNIFVYARAPYADMILTKDIADTPQLNKSFVQQLKKDPQAIFTGDTWMDRKVLPANTLQIYRLDPVDILVKDVLTDENYSHYKELLNAPLKEGQKENVISILVLGMGRYGTHFLKTALWFYQKNGCRVRFDVFDMGEENGDAEAKLKQACPELFTKNRCTVPGEAAYDIRFHKGIDCLSEEFSQLAEKKLQNTNLVFIALGDDDTNIQTAINLRTLFSRHQELPNTSKPYTLKPYIYAIIYDDLKLSNLHPSQMDEQLRTEDKKYKYQLNFVGTLSTQYSYAAVEKRMRREQEALKWHLDWARKEQQLHRLYKAGKLECPVPEGADLESCIAFKEALEAEFGGADKIHWYDDYCDTAKDKQTRTDKESAADTLVVDTDALIGRIWDYFRKPYDHNSSIAKAEHKEACQAIGYVPQENCTVLCPCENCKDRKVTEHMRWNAYMRANGFILGGTDGKNTLRKHHADLKAWDTLPLREKYKD